MLNIDDIKYNADGLVPAIVQDEASKEVLMMAYMSRESLEITLKEKRTCFYSRSRKELWRKGETSGNVQHLVSITADCDNDTLLLMVRKDGPACHTGNDSCFFNTMFDSSENKEIGLQRLYDLLLERKEKPKEGSYTNYLFDKGEEKILKKIGEETTEIVVAAMKGSKEETVFEIADLCYHVLVLMAAGNIVPNDILEELTKRHIIDNKVKQETMK